LQNVEPAPAKSAFCPRFWKNRGGQRQPSGNQKPHHAWDIKQQQTNHQQGGSEQHRRNGGPDPMSGPATGSGANQPRLPVQQGPELVNPSQQPPPSVQVPRRPGFNINPNKTNQRKCTAAQNRGPANGGSTSVEASRSLKRPSTLMFRRQIHDRFTEEIGSQWPGPCFSRAGGGPGSINAGSPSLDGIAGDLLPTLKKPAQVGK